MRVGYNTKPYEKNMEVYQNFSGGLNTVSPPDGMLDTELTDMLNTDISVRGSLKRRHGLSVAHYAPYSYGRQGYFRYYKTDGTFDYFFAINGQLYLNGDTTYKQVEGMPTAWKFQTARPVEAAQMNGILYIATGTKLLQWDGITLKPVEAYVPTTMEMTYIGSNILSDNPEGHLKDTVGSVASIDYVLPKVKTNGSNSYISARVYCTTLIDETYEFALQVRNASKKAEDWPVVNTNQWVKRGSDFFLGTASTVDLIKFISFAVIASPGDYEVRVSMRKTGTTEVLSQCLVPYTVPAFGGESVAPVYTVQNCNRIFLHWGRLMMYGDPDSPATLYMSHLNTPNYVPALLNLEFDSPRREPITTIVHYRNSLVIFTKSSTQALYGTGPEDYRRVMLHTDLGCIAPFGAAVMKNHIGFLSLQGVYALKTMGLTDDKATVEKLDIKIANLIPRDENALVVYTDDQLHVTFPNSKQRFRFYAELGAWTKDNSVIFDFTHMWNIDGEIFALGQAGLYKFDKNVYLDDTYGYDNYWETKYFNFGQPYHKKKLKEVQILTAPNDESMSCTVYVYADEEAVITPDSSNATVVDGAVVWNTEINANLNVNFGVVGGSTFDEKWILGESVLGKNVFAVNKLRLTGKCLRTRIRVVNDEPKENHFMGFAYVFKVKKA